MSMPYAQVKVVDEKASSLELVGVTVHIGAGLPGVRMIGMGMARARQLHVRLRTATRVQQMPWPRTRMVIHLHPDTAGVYSLADVGIWLAIQQAQGVVTIPPDLVALGTVGLEGEILGDATAIPLLFQLLRHAPTHGIAQIVIPQSLEYLAQAYAPLLNEIPRIYCVRTIREALAVCNGASGYETVIAAQLPIADSRNNAQASSTDSTTIGDFADVIGQDSAKFGLELAAIGRHHCTLIGPPGSGKSMLVARMPGIMPPLQASEAVAVAELAAYTGKLTAQVAWEVPLVRPHHSVSRSALLGGGSHRVVPGAVSLAHHGLLFLDEVSEMPAAILDSLRTPMEQGEVRIVRQGKLRTFPAAFQLILAANPCRCASADATQCSCSAVTKRNYLRNVSGPLLDRVDIHLRTHAVHHIGHQATPETSAQIRQRVSEARERSRARWQKAGVPEHMACNGAIRGTMLRREFPATEAAMQLLDAYAQNGVLSQRNIDSILRLSWTLADRGRRAVPDIDEVSQALDIRGAFVTAPVGVEV